MVNYVIKRSGKKVKFNKKNIIDAILRAWKQVEEVDEEAKQLSEKIANFIEQKNEEVLHVEDIHDIIEQKLMASSHKDIAKEYIEYRQLKQIARSVRKTYNSIFDLVNLHNEELKDENSNKNAIVASTQRDYMAGEVSKDITRRFLLPSDISEAHDKGIIHFHDADYFAQKTFNCFIGRQMFMTDSGPRRFDSFQDGSKVKVIDMCGNIRVATVRCYGFQQMQKVILKYRGGKHEEIKEIICTPNHRWVLQNGEITTSLKVGDYLWHNANCSNEYPNINNYDEAKYFCLGFCLGDGHDIEKEYLGVRLCGDKNKYAPIFELAGYSKRAVSENGDFNYITKGFSKQQFLNNEGWKYLTPEQNKFLFLGYWAADGCKDRAMIGTTDIRLSNMTSYISSFAGFHVLRNFVQVRTTNYKEDVTFYMHKFINNPKFNYGWHVSEITPYRPNELKKCWCVEEPITHTFTLDNGVVTGNCCLVNLDDMLQNGTVINKTMIEKPHSFTTACTIATQIMAVVASGQYGGQSMSLAHLAPFVNVSREKIKREVIEELSKLEVENLDFDKIYTITEDRVKKEIKNGVQILQYQINTLNTSNGQTPFVTLYIYLGEAKTVQEKHDLALIAEEVFKQRIQGTKNESGHWITPAFPKLIYTLEPDNITEDSEYWYLTKLAAECTAKRMVPDYISEKIMLELKGDVYTCMGCRSFLTPDRFTDAGVKNIANAGNYEEGKHKYYGRFNQGVVTINLVDVACSVDNLDDFWNLLEERCELCHRALQIRHKRLLGTPSDISPIHWQYGALARLQKGEPIDKLLYNGYSTISLGYAGLWECVYKLIGKKLTEPEGKELGLKIMERLNTFTSEWKAAENIDYSIYGTPIESTTYKFAKCLKERFGIIEGVTDKNYITNSYHVHVTENINAFDKLKLESEFQALSPGGAISYVEVPDMKNNIEAVLSVIKYIYDNIMYAELNTKSDYCQVCGYDGEINIEEDESGKLYWECPNCGNTDQNKMNVARRTCGYIGSQFWNQGRTQEIKERVLHL